MKRKFILFGNGLGRALDNDFCCLERGLQEAWDSDVLSEPQKAVVHSCLREQVIESELSAPTSEEELGDLQRVLNSCDTILEFENRVQDDGWLTESGIEFPKAIRQYFHRTACNFYNSDKRLPKDFQDCLRGFVIENGPHVATLNYDDLLYDCFADTDVFNKIHLRDGFFKKKFDFEKAEKWYDPKRAEGWFFHLHGSPLFINVNGQPNKINRSDFTNFVGNESTHLVLTNVRYKRSAIGSSEILSAYWKKLQEIIYEVSEITLVGYGGADTHLNDYIGIAAGLMDIPVRIIERTSGDSDAARQKFWHKKFVANSKVEADIKVIQMEDILKFQDW